MPDFLLELLSEEIPARMQAKARQDLARLFEAELGKAGLKAEAIETYATPRRLALIARGLPLGTPAVSEELKGPKTSAPPQALEGFLRKTGLTQDALEDRAGTWFARIDKPGRATTDVLAEAVPAIVRAFPWPKSMRWGAASLSTESLRWVRPLQGIVAMLDEEVIELEIGDVSSGAATVGHRFHHPGAITLAGARDYVEKLRACHVIVDPAERARIVREGAEAAAAAAGLALVPDDGLVEENAGLTEWPVPLLGRFDEAFLQVPREVIQLTMRTNQKYFAATRSSPFTGRGTAGEAGGGGGSQLTPASAESPLHHASGARDGEIESPGHDLRLPGAVESRHALPTSGEDQLAPAFICVANIDASDGGAKIVEGNQKVLAARLSDARFFWEQDLKVPLEDQAAKLGQIVFHEKLGTVADKVDRVAKLARWLVEEGIVKSSPHAGRGTAPDLIRGGGGGSSPAQYSSTAPSTTPLRDAVPLPTSGEDQAELASLAERAARLCKADLVTQMVGEFPELQGLIGGYLAEAQGEDPQVAAAIRDHYKPVGQGDEVPTDPVTVAVSLADKLDSLIQFFGIGEKPTGSRDPFALRRAALGFIQVTVSNRLRAPLVSMFDEAPLGFEPNHKQAPEPKRQGSIAAHDLLDFFADRLKVQQKEAGVRHDLIDAVFALGGEDDLVRLLARVRALQSFVETAEGRDLLAGYKRAANILKKEGWNADRPSPVEGEGGARSASAEGEGEGLSSSSDPTLTPPLGSAERVPPSPSQGEGQTELSYTPETEETALIIALDSAEPRAQAAIAREDFEGAMAALATLRGPVDAFFETVTVNDPALEKRAARLDLLARMRAAFHSIADFSRIEG